MSARFAKFTFLFCCAAMLVPLCAFAQQGGGGGGGGGGGNNGGNNGGNGSANNFFSQGVVGGVHIDTKGVLTGEKAVVDAKIRERIQEGLDQTDGNINKTTKLRMISLRRLEAAITKARDEGVSLPMEITYMAGLQRIEYVILSPDTHDVILAGPGEGLRLNRDGVVVGEDSGTPVIHLEDFLVAMRSVDNAREGQGISVSIDPTQEGIKELQKFFGYLKKNNLRFDPRMQPRVEKAMGQQVIRLTGVPADSRFSQALVAADYKMKRLSMGLEKSPIKNFPSFMEIAQKSKVKNLTAAPRFWMECNYEPIAKSEDGLVWQIRGSGVKTLTQESHFDSNGKRSTSVKENRFAKQWADTMTERFDELAEAEPAFRELRNMMDLSVVAAIIKGEQLNKKVALETPAILGLTNAAVTPSRTVPKTVPAQCSFVRIANAWLVSASGGIQLDSWGVAAKSEVDSNLADFAKNATKPSTDAWWWNAASN